MCVQCVEVKMLHVKLSKLSSRLTSTVLRSVKEFVWNGKQTIHKETYELKMDFAPVNGCFDLNIYKSINVKMDLACVP